MGFFDDLQTRLGQFSDDLKNRALGDINDYLDNRAVDDVIKIGTEIKGNLTQAQIDAGQTGQGQGIVPAKSAARAAIPPILILVGIGLAAYLILAKKRRR